MRQTRLAMIITMGVKKKDETTAEADEAHNHSDAQHDCGSRAPDRSEETATQSGHA